MTKAWLNKCYHIQWYHFRWYHNWVISFLVVLQLTDIVFSGIAIEWYSGIQWYLCKISFVWYCLVDITCWPVYMYYTIQGVYETLQCHRSEYFMTLCHVSIPHTCHRGITWMSQWNLSLFLQKITCHNRFFFKVFYSISGLIAKCSKATAKMSYLSLLVNTDGSFQQASLDGFTTFC